MLKPSIKHPPPVGDPPPPPVIRPLASVNFGAAPEPVVLSLTDQYIAQKNIYKMRDGGPSSHKLIFPFEKYCIDCLEKGTAIYIRITSAIIDERLKRLQAVKFPTAYVAAYSKLMANVILKSQLDNPELRAQNSSQVRLSRRQATISTLESLCQIADECNLGRPIDIDM
jgi:hypothetical protein